MNASAKHISTPRDQPGCKAPSGTEVLHQGWLTSLDDFRLRNMLAGHRKEEEEKASAARPSRESRPAVTRGRGGRSLDAGQCQGLFHPVDGQFDRITHVPTGAGHSLAVNRPCLERERLADNFPPR